MSIRRGLLTINVPTGTLIIDSSCYQQSDDLLAACQLCFLLPRISLDTFEKRTR